MAGADGVGEAAGTLVRSGGEEAGGFDSEMLLGDGADLVEAEAVELGHGVVVGGQDGGEVVPIGEALVVGEGGVKAADGFGFLVVAVPGEPVVVTEDEVATGAEEAGDGLEDGGEVGEVLGGVVEGGEVELGFSFEFGGEAADHVEAGDALHEGFRGPAAVEALAGVEAFEEGGAGFDEGVEPGVAAGAFEEEAEAVEAHAAADVDDVAAAAPGGEGFGPAEVAEFEGLADGWAREGVDAGGIPAIGAEEVGIAPPVVEGPAVEEADFEVGGARFDAGHGGAHRAGAGWCQTGGAACAGGDTVAVCRMRMASFPAWAWCWRRIPFFPVVAVVGVLLAVKECYPFSNFPMYSNVDVEADIVYVTDQRDRALAMDAVFRTGSGTAKKMYKRELTAVAGAGGRKLEGATAEDRAAAGRAVMGTLGSRVRAKELPPEAVGLRLYRQTFRLENGALAQLAPERLAELTLSKK